MIPQNTLHADPSAALPSISLEPTWISFFWRVLRWGLGCASMLSLAGFGQNVSIGPVTYPPGSTQTISGTTITTSGAVIVPNGADIVYQGVGSVTLSPGFHAQSGGIFRAFVLPDSDGDSMPDVWELAVGLNPSVDDGLADPDGDGLSNLAEYYLGRNPIKPAIPDTAGALKLRVFSPAP